MSAEQLPQEEAPTTYLVRVNHPDVLQDLAALPPHVVERLVVGVAVAEAQSSAVKQGITPAQLELYDWTVERLVEGPLRSRLDLRVLAQLRPIEPGLPAQLHSSTAPVCSPCRWCGRSIAQGEGLVHLTPTGEEGPRNCRAASRLWGGVVDTRLASSRCATPLHQA